MILLNSFVHRYVLASIIGRWLVDRPALHDARTLKKLINYNSYLSGLILDEVATDLFSEFVGSPIHAFTALTKGGLKDYIVKNPPYHNEPIDTMLAHYDRFPQDYYRETPYNGRVYHKTLDGADRYIGSARMKRYRRIAEKSSRRLIDFIFQQIKGEAEILAQERAVRLGIPFRQLVTPRDLQIEEFKHAERRIIKRISRGKFIDDMPYLVINDVLGIKMVGDIERIDDILAIISRHPQMEVIEEEVHSGLYNAINLTVRYTIDKDHYLNLPLPNRATEVFTKRGLLPEEITPGYQQFLRTSEDDILLEVIVSNFEEMLQSEIGRSMHEERIVAQRSQQEYRGSLARNVAWLLEYMLAFCLSPRTEIDDLPIKLWVKYMPDYIEIVMRDLFELPVGLSCLFIH